MTPSDARLRELALKAESGFIDIVFDGPPGPEPGRFVESENSDGESISLGHWVERDDGYWALRIFAIAQMREILRECEDYFGGRADADMHPGIAGYVPNEEMTLLTKVREMLSRTEFRKPRT